MKSVSLRLALASTSFLALASSAFAVDGQDLLGKINKYYEKSGATVAAAEVTVEDTTVTMKGVTFKASGADAKAQTIGDVTFEGVEQDDSGNYTVETITFPDVNTVDGKSTVVASGLTLSGVYISGSPDDTSLDTLAPFQSASASAISVSEDGKEVFSLASMEATSAVREDESGVDYEWKANGLKVDLSNNPDPKQKETIEKLGLQTLEGDLDIKGSWQAEKGTSAVEALTVDFKNVGKLNLSFSISGLTMDLIKKMEEMSKDMNDPAKKDAAGMQMMGLAQQLTFDNAEIRFDDASITQRALDYAGSQQGVSGKDFAQSLKAMAPMMVAQLNMPDLQNAISAAVTAYLDDPKNFTISAKPSAPVAFPMIMGAAMGAPNTLPQVLGVTVSANQ